MARRLVVGLTAALLAAGLVPAGAVAAGAQPGNIPTFGVQFHAGWSTYTDAQRIQVLDKLEAAGVTWVRVDMGWASIQEDARGDISDWYVDRLDFVVDAARQRGIQVLGTLSGTPAWANGGQPRYVPPEDPADYGWVANWMASHFRGRVSAFEVWNEPNADRFWTGTVGQYVDLLRAAYPQFKAGDPNVKVVLGGPANKDTTWIGSVYAAGAKPFFDVLGVHSYMSPSDLPPETDNGTIWTLAGVSRVLDVMNANADGSKEIWFTEYGWSAHPNTGSEANWDRGVTEAQQADYLVRSLQYLGAHRPYVTQVFWYEERNAATGDPHEDNFGLLRHDLQEKPAYVAAKAFLTGGTEPPVVDDSPPAVSDLKASPQPVKKQTVISFSLDEPATATILVKGPGGSVVRTLASNKAYPAGGVSVKWNRRNQSGTHVAAGTYTAVVTAADASANESTATAEIAVAVLATTKTVKARISSFFAKSVTIPAGSKIKWVNVSVRRHVLVKKGSWARALAPGKTYLRTFYTKGTIPYVCRLHPAMKGTIKVV